MHLTYRNVNDAFRGLVSQIHAREYGEGADWRRAGDPLPARRRPSRYGDTITVEEPVLLTYRRPTERVLYNGARDCNPFSLLYEALWMLAGRNDVAPLAYYTRRFKEFSDDGKTMNDAYGRRWRHAWALRHMILEQPAALGEKLAHGLVPEADQLDLVVAHLSANPRSRRAVIQMWDVEDDLLKVDTSRAVCCNLSVMFALRPGADDCDCEGTGHIVPWGDPAADTPGGRCAHCRPLLDMTVTNRSNDLVWGLLGANYVTFSVLQEYVAARLGADVGLYHHFTNNLHVYTNNWKPEEWLADPHGWDHDDKDWYSAGALKTVPLVKDPAAFEAELPNFVERHSSAYRRHGPAEGLTEPFLLGTAHPMLQAFHYRKDHPTEAARWVGEIEAEDWGAACESWLLRRVKLAKGKEVSNDR